MSKTIVSHSTAIKFWRTHSLEETTATRSSTLPTMRSWHAVDEILLHALGFDTSDIHVLIEGAPPRGCQQGRTAHHWKGKLPSGAIRKIRGDVYVASPEMCFLQAAQDGNLFSLIMYGMEICGTYTLEESLPLDCRYNKTPLTTAKRIQAFLDRCENRKGIELARKAIPFVHDGSASPMETALSMLLCMPSRYGGYGIPWPTLNGKVSFGVRMKQYTDDNLNRCDLYWLGKKLVVEYDSTERHYGEVMRTKDVKRANVLEHAGRRVITVTWQIVNDAQELEKTAAIIAKALGHRLNKRMDRRQFVHARNLLRREVLPRLRDMI